MFAFLIPKNEITTMSLLVSIVSFYGQHMLFFLYFINFCFDVIGFDNFILACNE